MVLALIAAVASLVCAVVAGVFLAVRHRGMDDRYWRLCIWGVAAGIANMVIIFILRPEVMRPTWTSITYIIAIFLVAIVISLVLPMVNSFVLRWKRDRDHQNALEDEFMAGV
jgi:peptidoglycan biosynthesis protein MviN/MurJ (putative lipid II flippase)